MSAVVPPHRLPFGEFVLDRASAQLSCDGRPIPLRPKAFDVLCYLVEHPDRLIEKDELLAAVWPGLVVGDSSLQGCLSEIRKALNEDPQAPRFIDTVHRRGYRMRLRPRPVQPGAGRAVPIVGRDGELAMLTALLQAAQQGRRQTVFIRGEAGIGKTTLVEAFLAQTAARGPCWVARGQCVTRFGPEVAYLPVFDALACLAAESPASVVPVLRASAPAWVVQMVGLMSESERNVALPLQAGVPTERLLREFAETLEALARQQPVLLWLDDLHDADDSTLELLGHLARRKAAARLVVIGSYRPAEMAAADHPLRALELTLRERSLVELVSLQGLSAPAVERYLRSRLPARADDSAWPHLTDRLMARTGGHPLFVAHVVEHLIGARGDGTGDDETHLATLPPKLDDLLGAQIEQLLPAERTVLDAASVVGLRFAVQTVAAVTALPALEVEALLEHLVERHRLVLRDGTDEWPDGTLAIHYRFRHALHQEAAYRRVPPLRRAQLHGQVARQREASHAADLASVAVELAEHFERSREEARAVHYARVGFEQAMQRSAFAEGLKLAERGLKLLPRLVPGNERDAAELHLRTAAAVAYATTQGAASAEAGGACRRALQLCRQADDSAELFPVLSGLFAFHLVDARYATAEELGERLLRLAERQGPPIAALAAHVALGVVRWHLGKLGEAGGHFAQRGALYGPEWHLKYLQFGHDPTVTSLGFAAPVLWYLGFAEQACRAAEEGVALARRLGHAYSSGVALLFGARAFQECGRLDRVAELVAEHAQVCTDRHFKEADARRRLTTGWLLARQGRPLEAIVELKEGLAACDRFGTRLEKPYHLTILADAQARAGRPEEGLRTLAEALDLGRETGEAYYQPEMHRLEAEMRFELLRRDRARWKPAEPRALEPIEHALQQASELSRRQQARALELRAAMSLVRWRRWQLECVGGAAPGQRLAQASDMLAAVLRGFTEGHDTHDLRQAAQLLRETAAPD